MLCRCRRLFNPITEVNSANLLQNGLSLTNWVLILHLRDRKFCMCRFSKKSYFWLLYSAVNHHPLLPVRLSKLTRFAIVILWLVRGLDGYSTTGHKVASFEFRGRV